MKNNNPLTFLLFLIVSLFITVNYAEAHSLKKERGSERLGYKVGPEHPAKKDFDFAFSSAGNNTVNAVREGASKWRGQYGVTITEKTPTYNAKNHVMDYSDKTSQTIAYNSYTYNPRTNVISKFSLNFNTYYMNKYSKKRRNQIALHEWGHTFGLSDLYESKNTDKVMYGYGDVMEATALTIQDVEGMYYGLQ